MAVTIKGLPQVLSEQSGHHFVVKLEALIDNVRELEEFGKEEARKRNIVSPRVSAITLNPHLRDDQYLLVVTRESR